MAVKVLTVANAKPFDTSVVVTPEAATSATDGFEATVDGDICILAQNTDGSNPYTLTIKYGNGMQGVADKVETVAQSTTEFIKINTGAWKNLSSTNIGKILLVPENVALKVKVIEI